MAQEPGRQMLAAVAIIAVAVIAGSLVLANSLNRVTEQLDRTAGRLEEIRTAVADAKEVLAKLPAGPAQAAARKGPDPNRRYTIRTDGSASKGPAKAAVDQFKADRDSSAHRHGTRLQEAHVTGTRVPGA